MEWEWECESDFGISPNDGRDRRHSRKDRQPKSSGEGLVEAADTERFMQTAAVNNVAQ